MGAPLEQAPPAVVVAEEEEVAEEEVVAVEGEEVVACNRTCPHILALRGICRTRMLKELSYCKSTDPSGISQRHGSANPVSEMRIDNLGTITFCADLRSRSGREG